MKKEQLDRLWRWSVWLADLVGPHVSNAVQDAALAAWGRGEDPPQTRRLADEWLQKAEKGTGG